jgi:hypothetical protein
MVESARPVHYAPGMSSNSLGLRLSRPTSVPISLALVLACSCWFLGLTLLCAAAPTIYPAPEGEGLSHDYTVKVEGSSVPVYICKVASADRERRWKAMDDKTNSATFFETAAFAYFDAEGPVQVEVTAAEPISSAIVLPSSYGLVPRVRGKQATLDVSGPYPRQLTLEINGTWKRALHIFVNPVEKGIPTPGSPGLIYFGPGIHEVTNLVITNNQVVYVAGGAIVRGIIGPAEKFSVSSYSGLKNYAPTFSLRGTNITLRGRGIIDGSFATTHARHLVSVQGKDIALEGVILRDSSTWTVPVRQSERVQITNLKLLGYRANSDGIDICNSRDVTVRQSFIRTLDDLIVVKTDKGRGESQRILAEKCVLWNEVAHALSVGAELRENVDDVVFRDCDVIHDLGREWTLRVYHCDAARISNIRFEDLRIEESPRLISLWIDKAVWSRDSERGRIDGVVFKNIRAAADPVRLELKGFDSSHQIENVSFQDVLVNGKPLAASQITSNAFVKAVTVAP